MSSSSQQPTATTATTVESKLPYDHAATRTALASYASTVGAVTATTKQSYSDALSILDKDMKLSSTAVPVIAKFGLGAAVGPIATALAVANTNAYIIIVTSSPTRHYRSCSELMTQVGVDSTNDVARSLTVAATGSVIDFIACNSWWLGSPPTGKEHAATILFVVDPPGKAVVKSVIQPCMSSGSTMIVASGNIDVDEWRGGSGGDKSSPRWVAS